MLRRRLRALELLLLATALRAGDSLAFPVRLEVRDQRGRAFADRSQTFCREWYPKIHTALFGPGYPLPFPEIKVVLEPSITEGIWPFRTVIPAYTDANVIHVNSAYATELQKNEPDDYAGILIRELTHVAQYYAASAGPAWLVEGIADYVRHKYVEQDIEPRVHLGRNGNPEGFELDRNKSDFREQRLRGRLHRGGRVPLLARSAQGQGHRPHAQPGLAGRPVLGHDLPATVRRTARIVMARFCPEQPIAPPAIDWDA